MKNLNRENLIKIKFLQIIYGDLGKYIIILSL